MLKKIIFAFSSIISLFLLSSCSPAFNHMFHRPTATPHMSGYIDFSLLHLVL